MRKSFLKRQKPLKLQDIQSLEGFEHWAYPTDVEDIMDHNIVVPFYVLGSDPWEVLEDFFHFSPSVLRSFKQDLEYKCPFTGNVFYRGIPVSFISKNEEVSGSSWKDDRGDEIIDMIVEKEFYSEFPQNEEQMIFFPVNCIYRSMLGHGFRTPEGPEKETVFMKNYKVKLNKNEAVVFKHWLWHGVK